jgi:nitrogen-specific signal transduction histidine kinase
MRWPSLGFRREVTVILIVSILLLVLLVTFTILSFHGALDRLVEDRRLEAAGLAGRIADQISGATLPTASELRQEAAGALAVALTDSEGRLLAGDGSFEGAVTPELLDVTGITRPMGLGPNELLPDRVAGIAPLRWRQQILLVRVDLSAAGLTQQKETLRILTWVASPYEQMLEKARLVSEASDSDDEMSFLLSTVERALGSLSDSEKTSAEDDILALERTLGPSLQSGLLIMDREGGILALNAIGSELLDVTLPEQGATFGELLESHPELRDALARVVEHQTQVRRQELTVDSDSGPRTLGLTVHVLKRDDGTVRGYLALFIDLTEIQRRNEQEKLSKSLAQLGELTAGMAHELRNSLGTLRGYLTLIDRQPDEEGLEDYLAEIRRETDHLQRVLEDFLSFARPGTARMEAIDISVLLRQASEDPTLGGKEVLIRSDLEPEDSIIKGDAQLLERAMRNLLHNACQAELEAGSEGALEVLVQRDGEALEISILDRGPGLADEMRGRLFEPFATHRPDGVGLGLALAHRIVDLHGGRLSLENRHDGGAVARLHLPGEPLSDSLDPESTGPV